MRVQEYESSQQLQPKLSLRSNRSKTKPSSSPESKVSAGLSVVACSSVDSGEKRATLQ